MTAIKTILEVVRKMKKVVLTSVRFRKKLAELSAKRYTFEGEVKICNKDCYFGEKDNQFFKDTKVDEEYLQYPLSEIGLYFINSEEDTMCLVMLEACEGKMARMSVSVGGICDVDSGEKYYIDLGDPIPDVDLVGEPLSTFELKSEEPMFLDELVNSAMIGEDTEFAEGFAFDQVLESPPMADLRDWKYKSVMLNNDIHEALFRFRDLDLNDLLNDLKRNHYSLVGLGLIDVRSLVDSITVCAFKNETGYSYISFYYGVEEEEFMVRIQSRETELKRVRINGKEVLMARVTVDNSEEASTLIHGFDFENFREYELAM